ncbi:BnaA08g20340D [Brassica napus]|uniref:BnaA08g20340D protein n=1 Tax=Brassica napus TaxID=3708 RepID=A0A078IYJ9_BRANA|nr:BnaA08g20340D [Brassica napus]
MHGLGKMCSSGTGSPPVAKDDELPENPIGEEEESTEESIDELNSTEENDSGDEAASAVNPLSSDAAQILPLLQNLLLNNDIQRLEEQIKRLTTTSSDPERQD